MSAELWRLAKPWTEEQWAAILFDARVARQLRADARNVPAGERAAINRRARAHEWCVRNAAVVRGRDLSEERIEAALAAKEQR